MLYDTSSLIFLSTLSLRRATFVLWTVANLLLFLSTLSLRRATHINSRSYHVKRFLSTLSLRRATFNNRFFFHLVIHFYPRSPCGERLHAPNRRLYCCNISIHALLAESDIVSQTNRCTTIPFLSTLSLRRATTWARGSRVTYVEFLSTLSLRRATFFRVGLGF